MRTLEAIGVDLSLTATGIASPGGATSVVKSERKGMDRLYDISEAVIEAAMPTMQYLTHVIIEGYSMGAQRGSQGVAQMLGELGGVVRYRLWELRIPFSDVPPATLKKFATGKGNAGKPDMLDASRGAGYEGSNNDNAVDAWWLRQFGLYAFSRRAVPLTAYRSDVIAAWCAKTVLQKEAAS